MMLNMDAPVIIYLIIFACVLGARFLASIFAASCPRSI